MMLSIIVGKNFGLSDLITENHSRSTAVHNALIFGQLGK